MPYRRLPNTITAVMRQFTAVREAWEQYPEARLIEAAHYARIADGPETPGLLSQLIAKSGDVPLALAAQAPLTAAANHALARLRVYVSHFHQIYDLGVVRGIFTAGGRACYGREVASHALPDLRSAADLLESASKIGPGEIARRAAEGAESIAMALPSAAEVAALYTDVKARHEASQAAQAFTDLRQNELAALYPEAQRLAVKICNAVEYRLENDDAYQHLTAAGRRAIARRWGVVYIYSAGETPDPGDPDAGNTPPPDPATPTEA